MQDLHGEWMDDEVPLPEVQRTGGLCARGVSDPSDPTEHGLCIFGDQERDFHPAHQTDVRCVQAGDPHVRPPRFFHRLHPFPSGTQTSELQFRVFDV